MGRCLFVGLCLLVLFTLVSSLDPQTVEQYQQWMKEQPIVLQSSTTNERGTLLSSEPITSRTILMTAPKESLLGWVSEYPENYDFDEKAEQQRLMHELLQCWSGHASLLSKQPFCQFLRESLIERQEEDDPAILWPERDRKILAGSYIAERIHADLEIIQEIQEQYDAQLSLEDIVASFFASELLSTKIVHNGQYQLVFVPVQVTLPLAGNPTVAPVSNDDSPRTSVGYEEATGMVRLWVDDEYEQNQPIRMAWKSMKAWRRLEIVGSFDPLDQFQDNSVPLDIYLRGYDKQYDTKMKFLHEQDFVAPHPYPLNDEFYYIDHRSLLSQPLMALLRLKHYNKPLPSELDLTESLNPTNERQVYSEISALLGSKLEDDYPTTLVQDTRQFERRQILEDKRKYRALGALIKEKTLLEGALRAVQFLSERASQNPNDAAKKKATGKDLRDSVRKQKLGDIPL